VIFSCWQYIFFSRWFHLLNGNHAKLDMKWTVSTSTYQLLFVKWWMENQDCIHKLMCRRSQWQLKNIMTWPLVPGDEKLLKKHLFLASNLKPDLFHRYWMILLINILTWHILTFIHILILLCFAFFSLAAFGNKDRSNWLTYSTHCSFFVPWHGGLEKCPSSTTFCLVIAMYKEPLQVGM